MGKFRQDGPNLILELDHQETTNLIEKEIPAGEAAVAGFLKVVS